MTELPVASPIERVKSGVREYMLDQYPKARFAWFEPPMVDERLRIGVEYKGQRHYVALTDALIERPDEAVRWACSSLQALIERTEAQT